MAIYTSPIDRQADSNFRVGAGYKLNFYEAGTTTRKQTYSSNTYATPLANPVVADGEGRFSVIWTSGDYKVVLTDASDVVIWTVDNYTTDSASATYAEGVLSAVGSAANVITASLPTAPSALVDQQQVVVELQHGANTIGNPTFNLNSLGAKVIQRDDTKPLRSGDTGGSGNKIYLSYSAANDVWMLLNPAKPAIGLPDNFINGLEITNNSGTPLTKLDIAAGQRVDSTGTLMLELRTALTKSPFSTFSVGDDGGAFSDAGTGATASTSTWYKVYIITKANGDSDIIVSDTQANALLDDVASAAGYIYANRIGYVYSNGSTQIIPHKLSNNRVITWDVYNDEAISASTSAVSTTVLAPPSQIGVFSYQIAASTTGTAVEGYGLLTQLDQTDTAPTISKFDVLAGITAAGNGANNLLVGGSALVEVKTNSSSQIRHRESANISDANLLTRAYRDDLGVA